MNRRDFAIGLGAAHLITRTAWAAADPIEGKDYTRLQQSMPVAVPGKIEVIEFFGYWCPHCFQLEPKLEAWVKKLPAKVNFRRIPVAWQPSQAPFQQLYFALELLAIGGDIHQKVFQAVHVQHLRLDSDAGVAAFADANGIDKAKLANAMTGFAVSYEGSSSKPGFRSLSNRGSSDVCDQWSVRDFSGAGPRRRSSASCG